MPKSQKFETELPFRDDGDMRIFQKLEYAQEYSGRVHAHYEYNSSFLMHTLLWYLQTNRKVPFRTNWNRNWYKGEFEEPEDIPPEMTDLIDIVTAADARGLLKLEDLGDTSSQNPGTFDILNQIGAKVICPRIDKKGNLTYVNDEAQTILVFDPSYVGHFNRVLVRRMLDNTRGQRNQLGIIYSFFPFDAYES